MQVVLFFDFKTLFSEVVDNKRKLIQKSESLTKY